MKKILLSVTFVLSFFLFSSFLAVKAGVGLETCVGNCFFQNSFSDLNVNSSGDITISGSNYITEYNNNANAVQLRFGGTGSTNVTFGSMSSFDTDSQGNYYALDYSVHLVKKFDKFGNYIKNWGGYGSGNGQLAYPNNITVYGGYVYVYEWGNARISKFDLDGNFVSTISHSFNNVLDIKFNSTGNMYVTDNQNNRIQIFDSNGNFLRQWGTQGSGNGQLYYPTGIYIDSSDNVYVTEQGTSRVQKLDSFGNYITKWSTGTYPGSITQGPDGYMYYIVGSENSVYVTTTTGTFIRKFGWKGTTNGQFNDPADVDQDSLGNIYVLDSFNNRVQKFDSSGNFVRTWGGFFWPNAIAVSGNDHIYVGDTGNRRIQKFDTDGNLLLTWGTSGQGDGQFWNLSGLAVDSSENIYVADAQNNRIQIYNSAGTFLRQFNWGGSLVTPRDVAVDTSGNIFVTNGSPETIVKFDNAGNYITSWGGSGSGNGQFIGLKGIAVDPDGYIYASSNNHYIQKFSNGGSFIEKLGSSGTGFGQFSEPTGVSSKLSGYLLVADTHNQRVQKISFGNNISILSPNKVYRSTDNKQIGGDGAAAVVGSNITSDLKFGQITVSSFQVDLTSDRNWSNTFTGSNTSTGKAFVANLNPVDSPGVSSTHDLYIPKLADQVGVNICPNATQLSEITVGCTGGYILYVGAANLSETNVNGQDYWVVSGLTGTGGLGVSLLGAYMALTPNHSAVSLTQEVTVSVGSTAGYISGDKVDIVFEPAAGFVLSNTCAIPTTDADGDSVADGSASIVGGNTYEYTFSSPVTGPTVLSLCANVTAPAIAGSYSVRLTDDNGNFGNSMYYVGDDNDVFVIANVAPSLSFNIRTLDDSSDTNVCAFGTVSSSDSIPNGDEVVDGASECGYSLAVGTNAANGFQVQIQADDQLNSSSASIADIVDLSSFAPGMEAYGINYVRGAETGRNPVDGTYSWSINMDGNYSDINWGWGNRGVSIPTVPTNFESYTNGVQYMAGVDIWDVTAVIHGLVIGSGTPAGYYDQVVTYTATANF
jgi:streptogramin lyase